MFFKSIKVNHCQQTVEISAPAIGRPAVRTSGGFYRGNIESFSETGPGSSFMFQHDSVSSFRSDYAVVIIENNFYFFLFYVFFLSPHTGRGASGAGWYIFLSLLSVKYSFREGCCTCVLKEKHVSIANISQLKCSTRSVKRPMLTNIKDNPPGVNYLFKQQPDKVTQVRIQRTGVT